MLGADADGHHRAIVGTAVQSAKTAPRRATPPKSEFAATEDAALDVLLRDT